MIRAGEDVLAAQLARVSIPKRFSLPMREVWELQPRFEQLDGKRPQRLAAHPRFRAAYDFLLLRAESGEADLALADWWTRFQGESTPEREGMSGPARKRRRRRRPTAGDGVGEAGAPTGAGGGVGDGG